MPHLVTFPCPSCAATLKAADVAAGKESRCPRCRAEVHVPPRPSAADRPSTRIHTEELPRVRIELPPPLETVGWLLQVILLLGGILALIGLLLWVGGSLFLGGGT